MELTADLPTMDLPKNGTDTEFISNIINSHNLSNNGSRCVHSIMSA